MNFYSERVVRWDKGSVVMIDQTKLPHGLFYIRCTDYREIANLISRLVVRGAPAIGVAAAMGLALAAWNSRAEDKEEILLELDQAGQVLKSVRPTAANLVWAVHRVMEKAKCVSGGANDVRKTVVDEALTMADEDVEVNHSIGRHGSILLEDGDVVLTHCKWLNH